MASSPTAEAEYAAFLEKVKRTVYVDNLSPLVTEAVLTTALEQFGNVKNVDFIPNDLIPENIPSCALVEMESAEQARNVVSTLTEFPFMISGMPRPVTAWPARPEMFDDRPAKPGRKNVIQWLEPGHKDFEAAKKMKELVQKHAAEDAFMHRVLLAEEEKLSERQAEVLKNSYKKFDMIDSVIDDGTASHLARYYKAKLPNE
ncbi:hypothetical protein Tsubulata_032729 [Turnera subulata]|uniref:RRM domain-containing protein n=1 Tax=Turnera subulata TaxID=218843 RepID=A0A9Q0JK64_9ROSI|nr:hypothetical protein Tsubulata_032729 [Turnera subulata]